jgi:hypothetical protein
MYCGKLALAAMVRTALRLRHKTSAWASWLPHWPTCMSEISRDDSMDSIKHFFPEWLFLFPAVPEWRAAPVSHHHQNPELYV